jgi:two-component system, cell cycle response regulator DivK
MKRILIIEDNLKNRKLEKDLLEVAGFEVLEAEGPNHGIIIAKNEKPDLIIMDVRLPDMLGTEAAKILREDKKLDNIPIIFVTTSVQQDEIGEIREIKNSGYISKPINTRTFAEQMKKFLEKGRNG